MNLYWRARWVADTVADLIRVQRRMGIRRGELVLDVGSGGGPNPRANVLCDKFVSDGVERHGNPLVTDRPLVVGDVEHLPFADKAFDFVICSHVLEHVRDPATAINELQRVARRGYIETPSAEWEKLAGFPFHRWLVSRVDGRLVFQHKHAPIEDQALRDWFARFQDRLGISRRAWLRRRKLDVYTWLTWTDRIPYEVREAHGEDAGFVDASADSTDVECRDAPAGLVRTLITRLGEWSRARTELKGLDELVALLRCPRCAAALEPTDDGLRCMVRGEVYPVDSKGRPWLLSEFANRSHP